MFNIGFTFIVCKCRFSAHDEQARLQYTRTMATGSLTLCEPVTPVPLDKGKRKITSSSYSEEPAQKIQCM